MGKLGVPGRLREFLGSRRFMWILTIVFGLLVILYFLFVTFLFNPFEDDLGDIAAVVPRQVDYLVRWKSAGQRFEGFPEPAIWSKIQATEVYRQLETSGEIGRWGRETGIQDALDEISRFVSNSLPVGVNLENDLLREVALAGNGEPVLDASFDGLILLRVSFKVKAGVSLLGFDFVRNKLPASVGIQALGSGRYRLPQFGPFGYQDAYLTRIRDVVIVATKEDWLDVARDLEIRSGEGSLAQASVFHDNVEAHLAPGDDPLELFLRWENLRSFLGSWPQPKPGEYWSKALAGFFNTDMLRVAAGYWLPGERFLGRFSGEVDLTQATPFQRGWLEGQSVSVQQLEKFAELVPADSFLFASISGPASKTLLQLESALDEDIRRILDEAVVSSGRYQGMKHLFDQVSAAVTSNLYVSVRRNDYPADPEKDPPHDDRPVPVFAVMGSLRDKAAYDELYDFFVSHARRFTDAGQPSRHSTVRLKGGSVATSFESLAIPGTGEILIVYLATPNVVVLSNSFRYLQDLALYEVEKMADHPSFQAAMNELQGGANLFLYLDPGEAKHWIDAGADEVARNRFRDEMQPLYREWRPEEERRQKQYLFGGDPGTLSEAQAAQLEEAVTKALEDRAASERQRRQPQLADEFRRSLLPLQLLDWMSVAFDASRRRAGLLVTGELTLD